MDDLRGCEARPSPGAGKSSWANLHRPRPRPERSEATPRPGPRQRGPRQRRHRPQARHGRPARRHGSLHQIQGHGLRHDHAPRRRHPSTAPRRHLVPPAGQRTLGERRGRQPRRHRQRSRNRADLQPPLLLGRRLARLPWSTATGRVFGRSPTTRTGTHHNARTVRHLGQREMEHNFAPARGNVKTQSRFRRVGHGKQPDRPRPLFIPSSPSPKIIRRRRISAEYVATWPTRSARQRIVLAGLRLAALPQRHRGADTPPPVPAAYPPARRNRNVVILSLSKDQFRRYSADLRVPSPNSVSHGGLKRTAGKICFSLFGPLQVLRAKNCPGSPPSSQNRLIKPLF